MSAFRSCLLRAHVLGIIPRPSYWWDQNALKATSTGVLLSTRPLSVRWQAPKKSQVTAKLRLGGKAMQPLPRAALSLLIIQRMADSWRSMLCALAFVPWPVTQLLHVFSTFSFISPSCDLCSCFYPWFPSWVFFFFKAFSIFLLLTSCWCVSRCILCPWPWLWLTGNCWSRAGGYHLEWADSSGPGTTMTSFVLWHQCCFPFLNYDCTCAPYSFLAIYFYLKISSLGIINCAFSGEQGLYSVKKLD